MRKPLRATCAMITGLSLLAPRPTIAQTNYAVVFDGGYGINGPSFLKPTRTLADSTKSQFFRVSSKYNQPRFVDQTPGTYTNPHRGTDFLTPKGRPVYAVWNGWVVYRSGTEHEVDLRLDVNNNNLNDDVVYVKYDHLDTVNVVMNE